VRAKETVVILFIAVTLVAGAIATGCGSSSSMPGPNNPPPVQSSPTPMPSPSPIGSPATLHANEGGLLGAPDMFSPPSGDTGSGGSGAPVDGITCDPTMSDNYHIHIWLGLYVNAVQYALPIAVGMVDPGPAGPPGQFILTAHCFYHIHTHDRSGIVHVEDPDPSKTPRTGTLYTLKHLFDIWGITVNATQVSDKFVGPVRVFTSGQVYRGDQNGGVVPASTLTQWTGDPNTIPLYSHEVIILEVGPAYPAQLPNIAFYTEF